VNPVSESGWIVVRNWARFQHPDARRGEGVQPWFKVYTKLSHNPDFEGLTWLERGLLLTIWIEFASSDGQLRTTSVSKLCQGRVRPKHLDSLIHAGFILVVASRPLAVSKQHASLDKRREEEEQPPPNVDVLGDTPNGRPEEISDQEKVRRFLDGTDQLLRDL
jgi:hypothetical protein